MARNNDFYKRSIELRNQGLSYSEITKNIPVSKSTLHNWFTLAGLTLTEENLIIKKINHQKSQQIATLASKTIRAQRKKEAINNSLRELRKHFDEGLFISGIMLYEAEGTKGSECKFSNSDYRLILTFVVFLEKYFKLNRNNNITFSLYIHTNRRNDLERIKSFWATRLSLDTDKIKIYWKKNIVSHRRLNPDYVGQISLRVIGVPWLGSKLQAISDIILSQYCR